MAGHDQMGALLEKRESEVCLTFVGGLSQSVGSMHGEGVSRKTPKIISHVKVTSGVETD